MNNPSRQTDRELFDAVTSGDARALAELAGRHARGLYDFALRGTLDERQAASVLDAAFERIRQPGTQVPGQIDFRTWLYSLCLVEILALGNEPRTARISTDDERFYQATTDINPEFAHWAWQAARGLRTRDYCVLDLTLRRGLTPEEVAEAASLTRSNLYASIGRARGAFEETFAAMLLFEHGRSACPVLDEMVENSPGLSLRPALRHQIIEHSDDCEACRRTLDALPPAAETYVSLADIEVPEPLVRRILGDGSVALPGPPETPAVVPGAPSTAASAALAAGSAALDFEAPSNGDVTEVWRRPAEATPGMPVAGPGEAGHEDAEIAADTPAVEVDEDPLPVALEQAAVDDEDVAGEESDFEDDDDDLEAGEDLDEDDNDDEEDESGQMVATGAAGVAAAATARHFGRTSDPASARPSLLADGPPYTPQPAAAALDDDDDGPPARLRQPLLWTYALMGVAAVIAIYLGIAVADALQSGGRDSGAVPLDGVPGGTTARDISCGDSPIELDAGTSTSVSFAEEALGGYRIRTLSFEPVSSFAEFSDLDATLEDPFTIRFVAKEQASAERRTEEFVLRIEWVRGEDVARSTCELLVHVAP